MWLVKLWLYRSQEWMTIDRYRSEPAARRRLMDLQTQSPGHQYRLIHAARRDSFASTDSPSPSTPSAPIAD